MRKVNSDIKQIFSALLVIAVLSVMLTACTKELVRENDLEQLIELQERLDCDEESSEGASEGNGDFEDFDDEDGDDSINDGDGDDEDDEGGTKRASN